MEGSGLIGPSGLLGLVDGSHFFPSMLVTRAFYLQFAVLEIVGASYPFLAPVPLSEIYSLLLPWPLTIFGTVSIGWLLRLVGIGILDGIFGFVEFLTVAALWPSAPVRRCLEKMGILDEKPGPGLVN